MWSSTAQEKPKAKKARKGSASKAPPSGAAAAAAGGSSVSEDETMIPVSLIVHVFHNAIHNVIVSSSIGSCPVSGLSVFRTSGASTW